MSTGTPREPCASHGAYPEARGPFCPRWATFTEIAWLGHGLHGS